MARDKNPDIGPHYLSPNATVLCKLGSIAVHAEEALSGDGHGFDVVALTALLSDPQVKAWLAEMTKHAMVPLKRNRK